MEIKDYTTNDKIYCYENSNVLINKLDLKNGKHLEKAERYITTLRLIDLERKPLKGELNFEMLKRMHEYIFGDIYEFAGKVRKVNISKDSSQFCYVQYLDSQSKEIFEKLKQDNYLKNLDKDIFIEKLVDYMGDMIHLHPFREGNGRVTREFFRVLCLEAGYKLDYSKFNKNEILNADIDAYNGKNSRLIGLMNNGLIELIKKRK
ncbi:MAG: cell filamentation protein Fic [Fusobacteria bacterium]|nr:cell filamentation protein Fic [Fusobacteriota bacterium]